MPAGWRVSTTLDTEQRTETDWSILTVLGQVMVKSFIFIFRRGLAHDADGDFLVNGMYL